MLEGTDEDNEKCRKGKEILAKAKWGPDFFDDVLAELNHHAELGGMQGMQAPIRWISVANLASW